MHRIHNRHWIFLMGLPAQSQHNFLLCTFLLYYFAYRCYVSKKFTIVALQQEKLCTTDKLASSYQKLASSSLQLPLTNLWSASFYSICIRNISALFECFHGTKKCFDIRVLRCTERLVHLTKLLFCTYILAYTREGDCSRADTYICVKNSRNCSSDNVTDANR